MDNDDDMQARFVYSLLRPAVRAAARFRVPIRALIKLVRLAYYEQLARAGRSTAEIADSFGQTPRSIQTLARELERHARGEFFAAERTDGLARQIEVFVAAAMPRDQQVVEELDAWSHADITNAIALLLEQRRITRNPDGHLCTAKQYVVMRSERFRHRIDSLNHFLDGAYRAVIHRMLLGNERTAMMKAISFSARADDLAALLERLERQLRRDLTPLDEHATRGGRAGERYTLCLSSAPEGEEMNRDE